MTASPPAKTINIHGTGLVLDGAGVLLRGPSGAGKSLLALELLDRQAARGASGMLVADDRIDLAVEDDAIVMRAPKAIEGLVELHGRGIVRRPFLPIAKLDLVVDLVDEMVRMLEEDALTTDLLGVTLPRCPVPRRGVTDSAHQMLLVGEALDALGSRR